MHLYLFPKLDILRSLRTGIACCEEQSLAKLQELGETDLLFAQQLLQDLAAAGHGPPGRQSWLELAQVRLLN